MNTKEFVAMQMAKGFTERKIPDLRHMRHYRKLTCIILTQGYELPHSFNLFDPDWAYEGYERFRDHPDSYYPNKVLPWETLLGYM